ncbi:MAG: hypothetical protein BJ554DRAFT_3165, partial [Olpidium bornovanus]
YHDVPTCHFRSALSPTVALSLDLSRPEAPGASTTTAAPTSSTAATMAKTFFRGSADTLPDWAKEQRIQKQAAYREMQEALKQQIAEKERARMEVKAREQEEEAREMERMQLERQALDAHFRAEIEQEQRQAFAGHGPVCERSGRLKRTSPRVIQGDVGLTAPGGNREQKEARKSVFESAEFVGSSGRPATGTPGKP